MVDYSDNAITTNSIIINPIIAAIIKVHLNFQTGPYH
jgi:hypothetical protein